MGDPVRPGPITQRLVGQGPCALPGVRYKAGRRGEGTPPYGGLQGARKNGRGRTPPLRGAYKECGKAGRRGRRPLRVVTRGAGRAESPGHGFAVTVPFRQGAKGTGDADCHSQCAHWLRNDRGVTRGAVGNRLADRGVRPYGGYMGCGKRAAGDMQKGASLWIFGQKNTRFKSGINLTILRRR